MMAALHFVRDVAALVLGVGGGAFVAMAASAYFEDWKRERDRLSWDAKRLAEQQQQGQRHPARKGER